MWLCRGGWTSGITGWCVGNCNGSLLLGYALPIYPDSAPWWQSSMMSSSVRISNSIIFCILQSCCFTGILQIICSIRSLSRSWTGLPVPRRGRYNGEESSTLVWWCYVEKELQQKVKWWWKSGGWNLCRPSSVKYRYYSQSRYEHCVTHVHTAMHRWV